MAAGMPPEQARRAARVKEAVRDIRPGRVLERTWHDLRYAARARIEAARAK